jgi:alpha-tubulin suppressor-like RCC1 family protein
MPVFCIIHFTLYFTACGRVYVWGSNADGQLGLPNTNDSVLSPVLLPFDQQIVHISCGYYHTAFVTGMLVCLNFLFQIWKS